MVKQAPLGAPLALLEEDVLIFGRIIWIENNEEKHRVITLQVLRSEDMKKGTIKVENDGRIYAVLPKGTYIIHQLDWRDPWDGPHWLVPKVAFQTAGGQHAYYLGTLVMDITTKRDIIGGLWVKGGKIHIEDEEVEAMEAFRIRYPEQEVKVAKALMIHDPGIPHIRELENQRVLLDVLRSLYFGIITIQ